MALNNNADNHANSNNPSDKHLKPRRESFLFPRLLTAILLSAILCAIAATACIVLEQPLIYSAAPAILIPILAYASFVAYRKESYELLNSTIVCHQGGLLNDQTTEIEIRNITHVKLRLPWLRHMFLGIGTIMVESAGTNKPVKLLSIREPRKIYDQLWSRMQNNGYDLTKENLLYETRPAVLGAFLECVKFLGIGSFLLLTFLESITQTIESITQTSSSSQLDILSDYSIPALIITAIVALSYLVIRILDYRKRSYRVFNDVVTYKEGFLTKHDAFIPYENISDASTKQTFWAKIFGLYNLVVSCQGTGSEIKFNNLYHGPIVSSHIDDLVVRSHKKPTPSETSPSDDAPLIPQRIEPDLAPPEEAWLSILKINGLRQFLPLLLLFPLFPLWLVFNIKALITYSGTKYSFNHGTIGHSFRFLSTDDREFAYEKITGLTIKRDLFDRLFGTASLKFWSIGSKEALELTHVSLSKLNLSSIMRQIGIPETSEKVHPVETRYNPIAWIKAHAYRCLSLIILTLALLGTAAAVNQGYLFEQGSILDAQTTISKSIIQMTLVAIPIIIFAILALRLLYLFPYYKKQTLCFNEHHISAEQGLFIRSQYFARYKNIKQVAVTKYPMSINGSLEMFIAGEELAPIARNNKKAARTEQQLTKPCSFKLHFITDVFTKGSILDNILSGRLEADTKLEPAEELELLAESGKSVSNVLVKLIISSVILFPLLVLLPLTIPITIIATKRWRYKVEAGRILTNHGVLFKKQSSILLDRIDSIQQKQGALGKMFKNGNVSIMTAGSSKPDMQIRDAKSYKQIYQEVKRLSQTSQ